MAADYFAAIEAGGTKFNCAVFDGEKNVVKKIRVSTTTPKETMKNVCEFFDRFIDGRKFKALGIGSFGPLDLNKKSKTYGYITNTPKNHWSGFPLLGRVDLCCSILQRFVLHLYNAERLQCSYST